MRRLGWLILKDLKRFAADRNGAILAVAMPVVLASLLGMLLSPPKDAVQVDVLVVDQDQSPETRALVAAIDDAESLTVEEVTLTEAKERLKKGKASVALVLPKGTGSSLQGSALFGGTRQTVRLLYDPSDRTEAEIAQGQLYRVTMEQVSKTLMDPKQLKSTFSILRLASLAGGNEAPALKRFLEAGVAWAEEQEAEEQEAEEQGADGPDAAQAPEDGDSMGGLQPPLEIQREAVSAAGVAAGFNSYAHNFAGMLCMFLMFWAIDAGKELVVEREAGVQTRLMLTPLKRWHIFLGRGVSTSLIALGISAMVYLIGILVFGIRVQGSWPGFILVLIGQAIYVGGLALLLAGVLHTERQISSVGAFVVLVLSFAGGAMFPSFLMPDWLQTLGLVLPTWWATDGLAAMTWRGLPLTSAFASAAALTGFGILAAFIGARAYRWSA